MHLKKSSDQPKKHMDVSVCDANFLMMSSVCELEICICWSFGVCVVRMVECAGRLGCIFCSVLAV